MFIKKSSIDEITDYLENDLNKKDFNQEQLSERKAKIITYLNKAAELLDDVGLEKEALMTTKLLIKFTATK